MYHAFWISWSFNSCPTNKSHPLLSPLLLTDTCQDSYWKDCNSWCLVQWHRQHHQGQDSRKGGNPFQQAAVVFWWRAAGWWLHPFVLQHSKWIHPLFGMPTISTFLTCCFGDHVYSCVQIWLTNKMPFPIAPDRSLWRLLLEILSLLMSGPVTPSTLSRPRFHTRGESLPLSSKCFLMKSSWIMIAPFRTTTFKMDPPSIWSTFNMDPPSIWYANYPYVFY